MSILKYFKQFSNYLYVIVYTNLYSADKNKFLTRREQVLNFLLYSSYVYILQSNITGVDTQLIFSILKTTVIYSRILRTNFQRRTVFGR
jgi:hypothetical protein